MNFFNSKRVLLFTTFFLFLIRVKSINFCWLFYNFDLNYLINYFYFDKSSTTASIYSSVFSTVFSNFTSIYLSFSYWISLMSIYLFFSINYFVALMYFFSIYETSILAFSPNNLSKITLYPDSLDFFLLSFSIDSVEFWHTNFNY